jgi:hypothetical protein
MTVSVIESQIATLLAKYSPTIEAQLREARTRLRATFPRGFELIYDNYNALVFAISPTDRTSEAFLSVAGYPKWITLFFLDGAALHDPSGLLEGQGKRIRSIRLKAPADINTPAVEALIAQSVRSRELAFLAAPTLITVIKSISASQRPRRPRSLI